MKDTPQPAPRYHDLDALRAVATLLGIALPGRLQSRLHVTLSGAKGLCAEGRILPLRQAQGQNDRQ